MAHTKIQYTCISNKGAVNELNKNKQKKEREKKKEKLPLIFKKGSVNKLNKDNQKRKINNTYLRNALLINLIKITKK